MLFFAIFGFGIKTSLTMNAKTLLSLAAACAFAVACAKPCRIVWTEGPTDPESGKTVHTMTIQNPPAGTDWTIWFSQFRTPVTMQEGAPAEILHLGGTLYRVAPTGTPAAKTWSSTMKPAPW